MSQNKPYYRIARIANGTDYIRDKRYAPDRFMLLQAYQLIENDLKEILEFVEPADSNECTYSHRIYELFLRCATEFETNCKRILYANGYSSGRWDIRDYCKVNQAMKLSEYEIKINSWYRNAKIVKPLQDWASGSMVSWYQDYNSVKHDCSQNFHKASLRNLIDAAASVIAILFAQFQEFSFNPYNDDEMLAQSDDDGFWYGSNSLFNIKPFTNWLPQDVYSFTWQEIKNDTEPFQKYPFH